MQKKTMVFDREHWADPDQWEEYLSYDILIPRRMDEETEDVWKSGFVEGKLVSVLFADYECPCAHEDVEVYPILVVRDKGNGRMYYISAYPKGCRCVDSTSL